MLPGYVVFIFILIVFIFLWVLSKVFEPFPPIEKEKLPDISGNPARKDGITTINITRTHWGLSE